MRDTGEVLSEAYEKKKLILQLKGLNSKRAVERSSQELVNSVQAHLYSELQPQLQLRGLSRYFLPQFPSHLCPESLLIEVKSQK